MEGLEFRGINERTISGCGNRYRLSRTEHAVGRRDGCVRGCSRGAARAHAGGLTLRKGEGRPCGREREEAGISGRLLRVCTVLYRKILQERVKPFETPLFPTVFVGLTGFEPATFCSQSRRATKLRYSPLQKATSAIVHEHPTQPRRTTPKPTPHKPPQHHAQTNHPPRKPPTPTTNTLVG